MSGESGTVQFVPGMGVVAVLVAAVFLVSCATMAMEATEADRAVYLPHPAHEAFGQLLGPYLDDVLVVDYWTKS